MSRIISNLILSAALVPMVIGVVIVTAYALDEIIDVEYVLVAPLTSSVALVFVYAWWFLLWCSAVRWTPRRVTWTGLGAFASCGAGGLAWLTVCRMDPRDHEGAVILGAFIAAALWIVLTPIAWRETRIEKAQRLKTAAGGGGGYIGPLLCPMCGYDMRGLYHARCPECGTEYTLDALLTANVEGAEPEARERATGE
ncbi:MAG: hypothetical protein ACOC95_04465 [Planctomycetota bacterium]